MRTKSQKYSPAMKQLARAKADAGVSLTDLAREFGTSKSTMKYWLDHPDEKAPGINAPMLSRLVGQTSEAYWDAVHATLVELKKDVTKMGWKERLEVIKELLPYMQPVRALEARGGVMPQNIVEVSEEIKVTVQEYLKKSTPESSVPSDLAVSPTVPTESVQEVTLVPQETSAEKETNGAT